MDYLVKIRSVQTPLNGQFSIGANTKGKASNDALVKFISLTAISFPYYSNWGYTGVTKYMKKQVFLCNNNEVMICLSYCYV